jgi:hypothetical protein
MYSITLNQLDREKSFSSLKYPIKSISCTIPDVSSKNLSDIDGAILLGIRRKSYFSISSSYMTQKAEQMNNKTTTMLIKNVSQSSQNSTKIFLNQTCYNSLPAANIYPLTLKIKLLLPLWFSWRKYDDFITITFFNSKKFAWIYLYLAKHCHKIIKQDKISSKIRCFNYLIIE